jgi:hypothetical protein
MLWLQRFAGIDVDVKEVLAHVFRVKNAVGACEKEGMYKKLERMQSELEMCEKSLANYLEQKRRIFPRFYFVSTSDLLDILSNGNDPVKVCTQKQPDQNPNRSQKQDLHPEARSAPRRSAPRRNRVDPSLKNLTELGAN